MDILDDSIMKEIQNIVFSTSDSILILYGFTPPIISVYTKLKSDAAALFADAQIGIFVDLQIQLVYSTK